MATIKPFGDKAWTFASRDPKLDKPITILEGSIRSGKTFSFHPKIIKGLLQYKVDGLRVIVGVSKQTVKDNLLRDLFDIVGEDNYTYNVQTGDLKLFGVNWLVIGAKDDGSEKYLRGKTIGIAIVEEAVLIPKSFFMQLLGRLSPRGSRLYANTNPDSPYHYLKTDIIDNPDLAADLEVIHFDLDDNPSLDPATRARYERMYSGVFYERMILGLWVIAQGAIYRDCIGPQSKFTDADRPIALYNAYVARYIGVDYGTGNPTVFLDCYDDGRTIWVDKEYYWDSRAKGKGGQVIQVAQKTDGEYADDFMAFLGPASRRGVTAIVDPSAASFKLELIRRGVQVRDAVNDVEPGIRNTASALKLGVVRVHSSCTMANKELATYSWDDKAAMRGEEKPIKQNDHAPDALRYVTHTILTQARLT
jgi:PBSX family phage terminase large subunit